MNKDNLFWGVVFLMAAIYILMRSVGMAPDVSIVRIIIGLLCITGFIKAAIDLEFGGMLFSLAILFIVFRRYIGLESMSSWSILMAALFGTIGLNMLFGDHASAYRNRKRAKRYGEQFERQQEQYEGQMGENTDTSGASQGFYDSNMQGEHIVLSGLFNGTKKNLQMEKSIFPPRPEPPEQPPQEPKLPWKPSYQSPTASLWGSVDLQGNTV